MGKNLGLRGCLTSKCFRLYLLKFCTIILGAVCLYCNIFICFCEIEFETIDIRCEIEIFVTFVVYLQVNSHSNFNIMQSIKYWVDVIYLLLPSAANRHSQRQHNIGL